MNGLCADLLSLLTGQLDISEYCLLLTTTYDLKTPDEAVKTCDWKSIKYHIKRHITKVGDDNFGTSFYIDLCTTSGHRNDIFECLAFHNNKGLISELEMYGLLSAKHCLDILLGASYGGHIDLIDRYSVHITGRNTEIYHPCLAHAITHKKIDVILHLENLYYYMWGTYFLAYGIINGDMELLDLIVNRFDVCESWGAEYMIRQEEYDGIDYFLNKRQECDNDDGYYTSFVLECIVYAEQYKFTKQLEYLKSKLQ